MDVSEMDKSDDPVDWDFRSVNAFNALFMESESQGKGTWPCMEPIPVPMDVCFVP